MTKVISLSDEAYKALKRIKGKDESFSDVILRLIGSIEPRPLSEFAGRWVGDDIDTIFNIVSREREDTTSREAEMC
ncbi:MAG: antitoxin VapB family protein [Candidatus Nitrosocaldus sp.]|nr:antitoxin VapB family protein [Candidatus Nitrosocaldus sp.]MCS7141432.1 antitoxin VapB family protein [Candidatus Nitrosocaldus sp.]MDW7999638.1 antitoxin VapB family protein [Candidatus Nitrosocaldus sp.]MDW8275292.1 antitoxin VapB family protein [Candidatus Nitrosocaldus sp.]